MQFAASSSRMALGSAEEPPDNDRSAGSADGIRNGSPGDVQDSPQSRESLAQQPRVDFNPGTHQFQLRDAEGSPQPGSEPDSSGIKKKYRCNVCDRAFTTSGHLTRHSHIHTGEKKYECPFPGCGTRCSRQDNLQQHYRTHLSATSRQNMSRARAQAKLSASPTLNPSPLKSPDSPSSSGRIINSQAPSPAQHTLFPTTTLPPISQLTQQVGLPSLPPVPNEVSHQHLLRSPIPGGHGQELPPILNLDPHVLPSGAQQQQEMLKANGASGSLPHPHAGHAGKERPHCSNCGTDDTPLWRRGANDELYCNACGLYTKSHKRPRPKNMATARAAPNKNPAPHLTQQQQNAAAQASGQLTIPARPENANMIAECHNCHTRSTPLWRKDEEGRTVCNACGLYSKLHGSSRPISMRSDTFLRRSRRPNSTDGRGSASSSRSRGRGESPSSVVGEASGGADARNHSLDDGERGRSRGKAPMQARDGPSDPALGGTLFVQHPGPSLPSLGPPMPSYPPPVGNIGASEGVLRLAPPGVPNADIGMRGPSRGDDADRDTKRRRVSEEPPASTSLAPPPPGPSSSSGNSRPPTSLNSILVSGAAGTPPPSYSHQQLPPLALPPGQIMSGPMPPFNPGPAFGATPYGPPSVVPGKLYGPPPTGPPSSATGSSEPSPVASTSATGRPSGSGSVNGGGGGGYPVSNYRGSS